MQVLIAVMATLIFSIILIFKTSLKMIDDKKLLCLMPLLVLGIGGCYFSGLMFYGTYHELDAFSFMLKIVFYSLLVLTTKGLKR